MPRRLSASLLLVALALPVLSQPGTAQSARRASSPLQNANRAFMEGRYNEIEALTEKLDARDPSVVALRARALIARGHYQEAEAMLRPVASRAASSEAALELGLLQSTLGRPDATPILDKVAALVETTRDPTELARSARALRALGRFQESNDAYREAAASLPGDPAVQTAWGELFLEKYERREALQSFQIALKSDPSWVPALIGSARVLEDEDPPQAVAIARHVLEINPSSVDADVFLAGEAIDAGHRDAARQALSKALAVNPGSLEARSLSAGLAYVEDKHAEFDAEVARVLEIAPHYGEVYREAGEQAAHNYRFDEAVALTRRALALDPQNARSLADLGTHLLRAGDEPGARTALEAAFKIDGYDKVTYNLLAMLDTLDKFVTVRDGDLVLRLSKEDAPLQEEALALAHRALKTYSDKYEFTPRGPILIEIFPKHDDFAVRNVGLPGMIGALGACFGRVVTMDSPRVKAAGDFQWEATLWHELAHVVTLQMSNQRVPRWLTEGISVYEETQAHTEWGREMEMEFAAIMNRGETIKLTELNAAFQNPKLISLAYFEGELVVEHMMSTYGIAGMRRLLRAYGDGLDTDAALKTALNTNLAEMQEGFDATVERMFGELRVAMAVPERSGDMGRASLDDLRKLASENPRSYPVQLALARSLKKNGLVDEAVQAFEKAATLVPIARGQGSPHEELAAIALERKDKARAVKELTALVAVDYNNVDAARQLAGLLRETDVSDPARLQPVYARITAVDPFDTEAHLALGRLALQVNQPEIASREFRTALALNPVDRAGVLTDLAESYYKAGKLPDAKKQVLAALEIAPTYERAQSLLLKVVEPR